jgi:hypothetical protein
MRTRTLLAALIMPLLAFLPLLATPGGGGDGCPGDDHRHPHQRHQRLCRQRHRRGGDRLDGGAHVHPRARRGDDPRHLDDARDRRRRDHLRRDQLHPPALPRDAALGARRQRRLGPAVGRPRHLHRVAQPRHAGRRRREPVHPDRQHQQGRLAAGRGALRLPGHRRPLHPDRIPRLPRPHHRRGGRRARVAATRWPTRSCSRPPATAGHGHRAALPLVHPPQGGADDAGPRRTTG